MTRFARYKKSFNAPEIGSKTFSGTNTEGKLDFSFTANDTRVHKNRTGFEMRKSGAFKARGRHVVAPLQEPERSVTCLRCRETGHSLKECTANISEEGIENAKNVSSFKKLYCYNCGSDEHTHKACPAPFSNFSHAICFVCNEKGHLASACAQNAHGVYPDGGGCHFCGSTKHLARNCRPADSAKNGNEIIITAATDSSVNPEADDVHDALQRIEHEKESKKAMRQQQQNKKQKKVVTF